MASKITVTACLIVVIIVSNITSAFALPTMLVSPGSLYNETEAGKSVVAIKNKLQNQQVTNHSSHHGHHQTDGSNDHHYVAEISRSEQSKGSHCAEDHEDTEHCDNCDLNRCGNTCDCHAIFGAFVASPFRDSEQIHLRYPAQLTPLTPELELDGLYRPPKA